MKQGKIIKGIGGFYYVDTAAYFLEQKNSEDYLESNIFECKPRGIFRHYGKKPSVGDNVTINQDPDGQWIITDIMERSNFLTRPPVSNVDKALICFSVKSPRPNLILMDKILANCIFHNIEPIICLTKTDLSLKKAIELKKDYEDSGFKVFLISSEIEDELDLLLNEIENKTTFLTGPSGVGKSTLSNRICLEQMETGDISKKLDRGKHTTRHVELLRTKNNGFLLDTPGFSTLDFEEDITAEDLKNLYPEFEGLECRFLDCRHLKEPDCAVRQSVREGKIIKDRYLRYKSLYQELENRKGY